MENSATYQIVWDRLLKLNEKLHLFNPHFLSEKTWNKMQEDTGKKLAFAKKMVRRSRRLTWVSLVVLVFMILGTIYFKDFKSWGFQYVISGWYPIVFFTDIYTYKLQAQRLEETMMLLNLIHSMEEEGLAVAGWRSAGERQKLLRRKIG